MLVPSVNHGLGSASQAVAPKELPPKLRKYTLSFANIPLGKVVRSVSSIYKVVKLLRPSNMPASKLVRELLPKYKFLKLLRLSNMPASKLVRGC